MALTMKRALESRPEIRKFSSTEAAWLAGVIDGEGSIGLYDYGREGRRVQVQMGNTNKVFVEEMRRIIGVGSMVHRTSFGRSHKGRKPMFHYTLKGSLRCYFVLKQVIPYLIIKKEKAIAIIKKLEFEPFGKWKNTTKEARRRASLKAKRLWKNPDIRAARITGVLRRFKNAKS